MELSKILIAWAFLMLFILIVAIIIKRIDKNADYPDKLDFVEWYNLNKTELLSKIEKRSKLYGLDIEAELDKEYDAYLQT